MRGLWLLALGLAPVAAAQEVLDLGPPPVVDVPVEDQGLVQEWEGGACRAATGTSGHHLYVQATLPERVDEPGAVDAMLGRVTARACGEAGLGYACGPAPEPGARSRVFERGQRVNGLLRLPLTRWLTTVTVTAQPKELSLRYTLYAEGPGPGPDGWLLLCSEARGLVAAALGEPSAGRD